MRISEERPAGSLPIKITSRREAIVGRICGKIPRSLRFFEMTEGGHELTLKEFQVQTKRSYPSWHLTGKFKLPQVAFGMSVTPHTEMGPWKHAGRLELRL